MTRQVIHVQYDGVWNLDEGVYKWIPHSNETTSIFVDDSMKYQEFMKKLHDKFCIGKDDIGLKVSYMPNPGWRFAPITIRSDECLSCYLFQCEKQSYNILLCVEVVEKIETEKVYKDCEVEENQMPCDNFENNINMEENSCDVVPTPRNAMGDDGYDFVSVPENTIMNDGCDGMDSCLSPPIPPKEGLEFPECNEPEDIVDQSRNDEVFCFTDESDLAIGQEFENKQEVKAKLHDVALNACFEMAIKRSTKSLYVVKCIDPNCKWAVRAAKVSNSERFSIRTYCNTHTCSLINRKRKNRQASASLVGMMVKSNFEGQKEILNPQTIMTMMKNRNVQISYWKAWRGKRVAQDLLMGSPKVSFTYLPSYLYMVEKMNPGTVTHIKVDDNEKFKYVFVAYGACIRGFQCMRKVVAVDGTWLKSKYRGVLLLATAQDGNFQQYPFAWAVVDSENDASWLWFFTKLQELIPDEEELVIISDRNQSIINGVNSVYKKSQYGHCRWHISQNIRARVRVSGVVKAFERTANAYKVSTFDSRYRELRNKYPGATKYLDESLDVKKWARSHFPGSRYNIMTTNGAESINAVLRDARKYPIISLLDAIQKKNNQVV